MKSAHEYFNSDQTLDEAVIEKMERDGKLEGQEAIAYLAQCFGNSTKGGENGYTLTKNTSIEQFAHVVVYDSQKPAM